MNRWNAVLVVCVAVLLGLSLMPVPAQADPLAFGLGFGSLFTIDLATATATLIGTTTIAGIPEGLALSPSGMLFATDSGGILYRINPATAETTFVGSTGLGNIEGLDFNGTTLVGSPFRSSTLFSIDTATANPTLLSLPSRAPWALSGP